MDTPGWIDHLLTSPGEGEGGDMYSVPVVFTVHAADLWAARDTIAGFLLDTWEHQPPNIVDGRIA